MKKLLYLLFLVFFISQLKAQTPEVTDTTALARAKAYEKKFAEADLLLTQYSLYDADVNAQRLHAQVLYWMKSPDRASMVYEKALAAFPENQAIKLDYGRMLFELGKIKQAEPLLTDYLLADNNNVDANNLLANINYWNGQIKSAKERLAVVLNTYPDNETALALLHEINLYTAPYVRSGAILASDDQPLKKTGLEVEAGWYHSWLFSPTLQLNFNHFSLPDSNTSYNSTWVQAGNKLNFGKAGLTINFKGGLFKHQAGNSETFFTGGATVTQKISSAISLEANTEKRPYQFTTSSASVPVMQQFSVAAINLNKNNKWLGRGAYQLEKFNDNNKVKTAYFWLLAPIVSNKSLSLKGGYAFNHSNADINRFTTKKSMQTIIETTMVGSSVEGYYNPYFTPNNQSIHAALGSIWIKLSDNINITSRVNLAFAASADNPVLFLDKSITNNYSIIKAYYKQTYTPIDFHNELLVNLSDEFTISGTYQYSRFLFYTINQGAIHMKYRFINEKK